MIKRDAARHPFLRRALPNIAFDRASPFGYTEYIIKRRYNGIKKIRKTIIFTILSLLCFIVLALGASAATTHTVVSGDTMWRIAVKYEVGPDEMKSVNPHIKNSALIYPGDVLNIPTTDRVVLAFEEEVARLVNAERAKRGLSPLAADWQLSRVARYKSQDMHDNRYFSHTSPVYGSPFRMLKSFGISYRGAGENIAKGYKTPAAVVNGWMNSSGHRANILNASFTMLGVGASPTGIIGHSCLFHKKKRPLQRTCSMAGTL